jgi:hypothetical protein
VAKLVLREGSAAAELDSSPGPRRALPFATDANGALSLLRQLARSHGNAGALRRFASRELLLAGVQLLSDEQVVGAIARYVVSGRVGLTRCRLEPLAARDGGDEATSAPEAKQAKHAEKTWIEIALRDTLGKPVAGEPYWIRLTDGSTREGRLNGEGKAYFGDLDPGECEVRFPRRPEAVAKLGTRGSLVDKAPSPPKTWVEIALHDVAGRPMPEERFWLKLPDGSTREGRLDKKGRYRVEGITPGACLVRFPDYDPEGVVRRA